jgi:hypothetical protein
MLRARKRWFSLVSRGSETSVAPNPRTPPIVAETTVCPTPKIALAAVEIGLTVPVRCALICRSASAAATIMMLMSAKSLRSSRYVKIVNLQAAC